MEAGVGGEGGGEEGQVLLQGVTTSGSLGASVFRLAGEETASLSC